MQSRQLTAGGEGIARGKSRPRGDWLSGGKRSWRIPLVAGARGVHSGKLHFDRPSFYFNLSWIYVRIIGKRTRRGIEGGDGGGREPPWEKGTAEEGEGGIGSREEGKVARFTRVVSRRSLANYNSICISSNKSRLSSHLCQAYTPTCFPVNSSSPHLSTWRKTCHKFLRYSPDLTNIILSLSLPLFFLLRDVSG